MPRDKKWCCFHGSMLIEAAEGLLMSSKMSRGAAKYGSGLVTDSDEVGVRDGIERKACTS
jgi:hypothetical protein